MGCMEWKIRKEDEIRYTAKVKKDEMFQPEYNFLKIALNLFSYGNFKV